MIQKGSASSPTMFSIIMSEICLELKKGINWNGTNMFLGCQKIEYHSKHCNIDPKEKVILEELTVVGKTSSCSCRTGILTQNREWKMMKKKKNVSNLEFKVHTFKYILHLFVQISRGPPPVNYTSATDWQMAVWRDITLRRLLVPTFVITSATSQTSSCSFVLTRLSWLRSRLNSHFKTL